MDNTESKNFNSAYRVHMALQRASSQQDTLDAYVVWANAFGIDKKDNQDVFIDVTASLKLLREEIDIIEEKMSKQTNIRPDLYIDACKAAKRVTVIQTLNGKWRDCVAHLKPDHLRAFDFCVDLLPDEGRLPDKEKVNEILELLVTLEGKIEDEALPGELISFLKAQIDIIRSAIRNFEISGSKAFKSAILDIFSEWVEYEDIVNQHGKTESVNTFRILLGKFSDIVKSAPSIIKFVESTQKIFGLLS